MFTQIIFTKIIGEANPVYSPKIFYFYLTLSATSRKILQFLYRNLLGPVIRKIQSIRESMGINPFISFNWSTIEDRMRAQITRLSYSLGSGRISFTLDIDGTRFAQANQISQKYKSIIGGIHTNHFITLGGISDREVKIKSTHYVIIFSVDFRDQSSCNVMLT